MKMGRKDTHPIPRVEEVLKLLRKFKIKATAYLDLGCSDGQITEEVAKIVDAKEVFGIDIDCNALESAKLRGIKTFNLDLSKDRIPLNDGSVDLITAFEVIEHLVNPDNMLKEAYRVLRRGGYFIISCPNLSWWVNRIVLALGYQPYLTNCSLYYDVGKLWRPLKSGCTGGHLRSYTLRALKELLEIYKFHVIKVKATTITIVPKWLRTLDVLIAKLRPSLGLNIIILARKGSDNQ